MLPSPSSPPISQGPAPASPAPTPPPSSPTDAGPIQNTLSLDPNLLAKAKGPNQCKPGDTYSVNLTVKANSSGGFDVVDTEPMQMVDGAAGPASKDESVLDPDEEQEVLGYERKPRQMPKFA